ncbi:MAG: hypothetical protein ABJ004_20620 [Cyclobacteriaceae bacterium]
MSAEISEYYLDNGWVAKKVGENIAMLYVTPIENSFFRSYLEVPLTKEEFEAISRGQTNTRELFAKFNLHVRIINLNSQVSELKVNNSDDKFYGRGFIAFQEGDRYYLKYQLAVQGGCSRRFEISKKIYEDARTGNKTTKELFDKWGLHKYDNPSNDME